MVPYDDVIELTGHRRDIKQPCEPLSGESVWRFRQRTDRQQVDFQVHITIFHERFPNSHELDNVTPFSFTAQESGATISEVEPSGKVLDMMPQISLKSLSFSKVFDQINISLHTRRGREWGYFGSLRCGMKVCADTNGMVF